MTWSMPTWSATASAVAVLSPVTIHTCRPRAFSWATASAASGLTVSATVTRPARAPSTATYIGVPPAAAARAASPASGAVSTPRLAMCAWLPTATLVEAMVALMPCPGWAAKSVAGCRARPRSRAAVTMASPTGCSLPTSAEATRASSSSDSWPWEGLDVLEGRVGRG